MERSKNLDSARWQRARLNRGCPEAETILGSLDLYTENNIDLIGAVHACRLKRQGLRRIATHGRKHFQRIPWLEIAGR